MGPLVPFEIVGSELNYVLAVVLGFFFGFILEQAGFSSSRKLAGVFYGYDFVVLKVFFTAAITAMVGLIFFNYLGWIDMSVVYINPTFVGPAIVGGIVMGVGFIFGGFCPGTSVTGAVIGKIDAMVFVLGLVIGIFIFGESFPLFKDFYKSGSLGGIRVFNSLGISQSAFAFFLIIMALMAFTVTSMIEKKVMANYNFDTVRNQKLNPRFAALFLLFLGVLILFIPDEEQLDLNEIKKDKLITEFTDNKRFISPTEAAFHIMNNNKNYKLIDIRPAAEYQKFSLPGAINMPLKKFADKSTIEYLNPENEVSGVKKILYSNGNISADKVWLIMKRKGYNNFYVLEGGLNNFVEEFFLNKDTILPAKVKLASTVEDYKKRFKVEAKKYFSGMQKQVKKAAVAPVNVKRVARASGGC